MKKAEAFLGTRPNFFAQTHGPPRVSLRGVRWKQWKLVQKRQLRARTQKHTHPAQLSESGVDSVALRLDIMHGLQVELEWMGGLDRKGTTQASSTCGAHVPEARRRGLDGGRCGGERS